MTTIATFGDPRDPALLLIHGGGSTMLSWDEELCARLAAGSRFVIRYDQRPAGALRDLVDEALQVLDGHDVARAHLVGMSFGAGIAQSLALDHPARVASLTLASATPGGPGHSQPDLPGWHPSLFENEPQVPDWSDRDAVIDYLVEVERPYSPAFDEAAMRSLAARVFDHAPDLEQRLTGGSGFDLGAPWRERLGEIDVPTLVIHGADDPLFPLAHGQALADEIPGARLLVLEPCGHEYFPPATWDVVVPAILRVSGG